MKQFMGRFGFFAMRSPTTGMEAGVTRTGAWLGAAGLGVQAVGYITLVAVCENNRTMKF